MKFVESHSTLQPYVILMQHVTNTHLPHGYLYYLIFSEYIDKHRYYPLSCLIPVKRISASIDRLFQISDFPDVVNTYLTTDFVGHTQS